MKKKTLRILILIVVIAALAAGGVLAAVNYGTKSDPLITMSYLNDVVIPTMNDRYNTSLNNAAATAKQQFAQQVDQLSGGYTKVTLNANQTLTVKAGAELLPVSGNASAAAALTDVTAGSTLAAGGALAANHLYLAQADGAALKAANALTLMVRGTYSIG